VLGGPREADGLQVITGIPVTGPDVRQLAAANTRDSVIPQMSHRAQPALMPSGTGSAFRLWVTFFWCERTLAAPQQPVLVRLDGMSE
jgi:hypothetical protein